MKRSRLRTTVSAIFATAAALVASPSRGQSYGDQSQVLTIGVSQFRGVEGAPSSVGAGDYYLYNHSTGFNESYLAPLPLPEGALIERICLSARDTDVSDFVYVGAHVFANKLVPLDGTPTAWSVPGASAMSSGSDGYGSWCSNPLAYTLRGRLDVDSDGTLDDAVHYVGLYLPNSVGGQLGFGGVQITWRRQVSPPPSTATFEDVPMAHPFSRFIEALAASGITGGCGNGNFCPDAKLTRGQMAVFLAKALGLHWVE